MRCASSLPVTLRDTEMMIRGKYNRGTLGLISQKLPNGPGEKTNPRRLSLTLMQPGIGACGCKHNNWNWITGYLSCMIPVAYAIVKETLYEGKIYPILKPGTV